MITVNLEDFPEHLRRGKPTAYTYRLRRPSGEVFYIGKGTGNRIDMHEREARRGVQSRKCDIIREIWASGEQIIKEKVHENLPSGIAYALEQRLIKEQGEENLANVPYMGRGMLGKKIEEPLIPPTICLGVEFRRDADEDMRRCMEIEGLPLTMASCREYVWEICSQAISEHIKKMLGTTV